MNFLDIEARLQQLSKFNCEINKNNAILLKNKIIIDHNMMIIERNKIQLLEVENTLMKQELQLEVLQQNKMNKLKNGEINNIINFIEPVKINIDFHGQKKKLFMIAEKIFGENQAMFQQNQNIQEQNLKIKNKNISIQQQMNKISGELNQYLVDQQNNYL